jgi:hypothetical protein
MRFETARQHYLAEHEQAAAGFPRALGADFSAMILPPQITSRLFVLITADYIARLEILTRPADVLSSKSG